MYEPLHHMKPAQDFVIGPPEKAQAYACAHGDLRKGVQLADRLFAEFGPDDGRIVERMIRAAGESIKLTPAMFDRFADAFALADLRRRMRECGLDDQDEPDEPEPQPESD